NVFFRDSIFHGITTFTNVRFGGEVQFTNVRFGDEARFDGARFASAAWFQGTQFRRAAYFGGAHFDGVVADFSFAHFEGAAEFRATDLAHPPTLDNTSIAYTASGTVGFWRRMLWCAATDQDAARYRRLKQLASEAKDHERELKMFALELRAKRFH